MGAFTPNPQPAKADIIFVQLWMCGAYPNIPGCQGFNNTILQLTPNSLWGTPGGAESPDRCRTTDIECYFTKAIGYILLIPATVTSLLSALAKITLTWVIGIPMLASFSFTGNQAVLIGWPIIRNLANMGIVLGFIAIAMATILRIREYEAKTLLWKLVIAALLVNFSLVICGVLIDISHALMALILNLRPPNGEALFSPGEIDPFSIVTGINRNTRVLQVVGALIGIIFTNLTSFLILILYVFLFLFRIIALWVLVIFSPLAFICAVFPATQGMYQMWKKNFIQWCFIGVSGAFFLAIGEKLMKGMTEPNPIVALPAATELGGFATLFTMLVPGIFMVIGFMVSLQTSAMGTGYAISAFNKTKGYMKSGAGWAGKTVADKGGLTKTWDNVKVGATRMAERVPVFGAAQGTGDALEKKLQEEKLSDTRKRMSSQTDANNLARMYHASTSDTEKSVIVERLQKLKALDALGSKGAQEKALSIALKNGVSADEIIKDADFAHLDKSAIANAKRKQALEGKINPKTGTTYTGIEIERSAEAAVKREKYAKMPDPESVKLNDPDKIAKIIESAGGIDPTTGKLRSQVDSEGAALIDKMSKDGSIGKLNKALEDLALAAGHTVNGLEETAKQMDHTAETFGSDAYKDAKKSDPRFIKKDRKAIEEEAQSIAGVGHVVAPAHIAAAEKKLVSKGYSKLEVSDIRKMETDAMDIDLIINTTANKIAKAGEDLAKDKIKKLKTLALPGGAIDTAITTATAAGDTELVADLQEKKRKIDALT